MVSDLLAFKANGLEAIQKYMEPNLIFSRSALRRLLPLLYGVFLWAYSAYGAELPLKDIKLPPGFEIGVYAGNVPNARSLTLSPKGTLFVGSLKEGKVYAVVSQAGETEAKNLYRGAGIEYAQRRCLSQWSALRRRSKSRSAVR